MSLEKFPNFLPNFSAGEMNGEGKHFYRFKSFRLDVEERQLIHHGAIIPLTPKAFDVLALLVERNGHLVEKEELLQTVWADSFVEEANIPRIIHTLRKILGEDENGNKFIETVAKKGYRFVAKVTEVRPKAEQKTASGKENAKNFVEKQSETAIEIPSPAIAKAEISPENIAKPKTRIILFAVGFLSAIFLIVLLSFNFQSGSSVNPNKPKSIAVLPLKPVNTANRDELYEIGIAESLIHRLSAMKGFVVRPLSATRKYTDLNQDSIAAGKEQKTDYVLTSNYQLADGKIRVTAQLYNVQNGQIEETFKIEKEAGGIFALQDAIAGEIGNKLAAKFLISSSDSAAKRGTTNEEAYRLYLQGMFLVDTRNAADTRKAVEIFDKAVRLDPNYAQAWAGKAYAHRTAGNSGRKADTPDEYQKSIEAVNKALALDADSADAYGVLCENKMYYEYDFAAAETACRRAVELNPQSALAHQIYNRFLNSRGRFDEAIAEIKTAIDLEPASLFNQRLLGVSLHYARRYEEAATQFKRVAETDEDTAVIFNWLSQSLALQGKEAEAFEAWIKNFKDEETVRAFQTAFQTQGWLGVTRLRAERFEQGNEIYFHGAAYNALIGNKDKAFEYLEKSLERREWGMAYLEVDPRFDNLRGDARFTEFVSRIGKK